MANISSAEERTPLYLYEGNVNRRYCNGVNSSLVAKPACRDKLYSNFSGLLSPAIIFLIALFIDTFNASAPRYPFSINFSCKLDNKSFAFNSSSNSSSTYVLNKSYSSLPYNLSNMANISSAEERTPLYLYEGNVNRRYCNGVNSSLVAKPACRDKLYSNFSGLLSPAIIFLIALFIDTFNASAPRYPFSINFSCKLDNKSFAFNSSSNSSSTYVLNKPYSSSAQVIPTALRLGLYDKANFSPNTSFIFLTHSPIFSFRVGLSTESSKFQYIVSSYSLSPSVFIPNSDKFDVSKILRASEILSPKIAVLKAKP